MPIQLRVDAAHPRPTAPHSASLPEVELEIVRGQARERHRSVTTLVYLIGTAGDCDLVLGDPRFTTVHSYLLRRPEGVVLRHLGFAPDLAVNGELVHSVMLADGDRIRTGPFEFRVRIRPGHRDAPRRCDRLGTAVVEEQAGERFVAELLSDIRAAFPGVESRVRIGLWPSLSAESRRSA